MNKIHKRRIHLEGKTGKKMETIAYISLFYSTSFCVYLLNCQRGKWKGTKVFIVELIRVLGRRHLKYIHKIVGKIKN
jgi:hypothetical protein